MFTSNIQKNTRPQTLKSHAGFTLIEMLVAVFIFSLALAAFMGIASRGLQVARYAQDEVRAQYLAIEAIEVVRNVRDQAFIGGVGNGGWDSIFNQNGCLDYVDADPDNNCAFEFGSEITIFPCTSCIVHFNQSNGDYRQFETVPGIYLPTDYTRKIRIERVLDGLEEVIVTVEVSWSTGSVEYTTSLLLWAVS